MDTQNRIEYDPMERIRQLNRDQAAANRRAIQAREIGRDALDQTAEVVETIAETAVE